MIRVTMGTCSADAISRFVRFGRALRDGGGSPGSDEEYVRIVLDHVGDRVHDLLLVETAGDVTARALVVASSDRPDAALLGLYEAADGAAGDEATRSLLQAADRWAVERGLARILAPVDGSTWFSYRFRLPDPESQAPDDVGARRFSWEPSHPPAYLRRFRAAGFTEALDFETVGLVFPPDGAYGVAEAEARTGPALEAARAGGYRVSTLRDCKGDVPWADLHDLSSRAFETNPLYEPLDLDVFQRVYGGALGGEASDFTHWLRGPGGQLAGVVFAFRDSDAVVIKSIAVHPARQGRRLSTALVHLVLHEARRADLHEIVSAMVRTGNASEFLSRRHMMHGVETWRHRYAVLEREVGR